MGLLGANSEFVFLFLFFFWGGGGRGSEVSSSVTSSCP